MAIQFNGEGPPSTRVRDFVNKLHVDDTVGGSPIKTDSIKLRPRRLF